MRAFWFSLMALAACTGEGKSAPPDTFEQAGCGEDDCHASPVLSVSPMSIDMGTVAVSSTSMATTVTIKNSGFGESGSISAIVSGTSAAEFTVQNGCTTLAGGGTCVVSVVFKPTTAGAKTANLVVTGSPGGTVMVAISAVAN